MFDKNKTPLSLNVFKKKKLIENLKPSLFLFNSTLISHFRLLIPYQLVHSI